MQHFFPRIVAIFLLLLVSGGAWGNSRAYLTVEANNDSYGTVSGGGQSSKEQNGSSASFNVNAVPNDGYYFVRWEFTSGSGTIADNTASTTSVSVNRSNSNNSTAYYTIQAVFAPLLPTAITSSNLELAKQETASVPYTLTPANAYANLTYTSSNSSIATVDANGVVTGVAQGTATITIQARNASNQNIQGVSTTCTVTVSNLTCESAGYVITSGNSHFLGGNSTTDITTFNPSTCLWTKDGNKFKNASNYYLTLYANLGLNTNSNANGSNMSFSGTESGTTGQKIYYDGYSDYYLRYNSGWTYTTTAGNSGTNVVFSVKKIAAQETSTEPTITGDATFNAKGDKTYTHSNAAYTMGYNDYIFYDGAHHYWKSDDSEAISGNTKPTAETFTYTWSLSANASGHATVDNTGKVTYSTYFDDDTDVTLTLTATSTNKTFTVEKTVKFLSPKDDPTSVSASNMTLNVGEKKTITPTLTPSPCYTKLEYTSDPTTIATVDQNTGEVTGVAGGQATITIKAYKYSNASQYVSNTITVTVMEKVATPVIEFTPNNADGGDTGTATISCATNGAKIYYTTDGTTPSASSTEYTAPFTVNNLDEVKAIAYPADATYWDASEVATATYSKHKVATPTITINNGKVSFSCEEEGVTYYYTTNGDAPTTGSTLYTAAFTPTADECTIKVIATKAGAQNSDVATATYVVQSGTSDTKVILNDYEDHNWTYYKGVDASVDGDHYNTAYLGKLYSPNPRNVKITYNAVNDVTGSTTSVKVSTKSGESQTSFVYYKTLEQGTTSGEYPYQVISNPFSVRPSTGSGTSKTYYGFAGWKIVSGGDYIKDHSNNDVLDLDEEIVFEKLPYPSVNCTSAEIVFETTWEQAHVQRGGANVSNSSFASGNYETNFCVINANYTNALAPSYPVTITSVEPDGSSTYNVTFSNLVTPVAGAANTTKLEYMTWNPSGNIDARGRNLTIGRGVTCGGTTREFYGTNQTAGATNIIDQVLKIESGTYSYFRHFTSSGTNRIRKQIVVFGCDYDRAKGDNAKLSITGRMIGSEGSGAANESGTHDANLFMSKIYMKSGTFMSSVALSGAGYQNSYYLGINSASNATGKRLFEMEGGDLQNSIAGGMDVNMNGTKNSDQYINVFIRIRGGHVKGCIYGAARYAESQGSRQIVLTGGEVNGWIAGGANGDETTQGATTGASYIYVGGNAKVGGEGSETSIGSSIGGCVYGAGCGYGPNSTSGNMVLGTNVVVADNAYIERGVYGGGAFGYCATDKTANIYITGGHVEGKSGNYKDRAGTTTNNIIGGVFGGARMRYGGSANIYMTGGWVETGVYGGSNYTGTMESNVNMVITGGKVGTDATHTGNVHGGGYGNATRVLGSVNLAVGSRNATTGAVSGDAVIYGDVYGGSAQGKTNGNTSLTSNTTTTTVTLNSGTINGSLYGGGLGDNTYAADVYGPVAVKVYGGTVNTTSVAGSGAVYGCNNVKGAPQSTVNVDIYRTDPAPSANTYALDAVYGGGNAADYLKKPVVVVHGCDNSIGYVYGGGNAAAVGPDNNSMNPHNDATDVTIYGGNKIGNVFGGGNGQQIAANVNGNTRVKIYGGTIGDVYGGSNTNGTIMGSINVNVNAQAETGYDACRVNIDNVYGGGNKAPSAAGNVTIGCAEHIGAVYGGANQANIAGNIALNINSGHIDNVFGGNNNSGSISGTITVTVNEDKTTYPCGMEIGNVYGGGNIASYTGSPTVNIQNGTTTGSVFGGGLGAAAVVVGNPIVNIGKWGSGEVVIGGNVFGGGDAAAVEGNPVVTIRNCNTNIKKNVYGGGNAAPTYSTTTTIWGGLIEGNVFGGGNGEKGPEYAANVGYDRNNTVSATASGSSTTNIYGGTIGTWNNGVCIQVDGKDTGGIFGGSNANGNIKGAITITLDQIELTQAEKDLGATDKCNIKLKEAYGSGNQAAYGGTGITFNLGCIAAFDEIYGGAKQADMGTDETPANIHLKITSGHFTKVFGGNNLGGCIKGSIKVTIDETGCHPVIIDELYGGGNQAAYSIYGYNADKTIKESGEAKYSNPEVNVVSCSHIGQVFGGGYGASAVVAGNPIVNIQQIPGKFVPEKAINGVDDDTNTDKLGTIGTVFGGGNAANVVGDTHVNIGTETEIVRANGTDKVKNQGANITGNVYGGGNRADVTGKTYVQVGPTPTSPTPTP